MMPSPSELKYFLEVAHTGNMSRAAERLGISQPALTLAIQRLEDSFGQAVFIRSKTGVRLTRSGTKLMQRARFLFEEWDKILEEAKRDSSEVHGTYSLGCHPSVAQYTLPHFLPKLMELHPQLDFRIFHDLSRKITEEVISSRIDFALVINPTPHPDLVIKELLTDEVKFWAAKTRTQLQNPKSDKAVLICDPDLMQSQSLLKQLSKKGFRFQRTILLNNLEVICSLVSSGAGIGILPQRVAEREKIQGLKALPGQFPKFHDKCCLIYRSDSQKTEASRVIVKSIIDNLRDE